MAVELELQPLDSTNDKDDDNTIRTGKKQSKKHIFCEFFGLLKRVSETMNLIETRHVMEHDCTYHNSGDWLRCIVAGLEHGAAWLDRRSGCVVLLCVCDVRLCHSYVRLLPVT